jgi:hypothetical protein
MLFGDLNFKFKSRILLLTSGLAMCKGLQN